jgi:hypothetical protein
MRYSALFCIIIFLLSPGLAAASGQIYVSLPGGDWTVTRGPLDLTGGAGTDLDPDEESASDLITINIVYFLGNYGYWRVDVQRTDTVWHTDLSLYIRRTTDGTAGSGSNPYITGGTNYQEITTVAQEFFNGHRARSNIDAQLRLDGMSVNLGQNTYTTTITYTLIDL